MNMEDMNEQEQKEQKPEMNPIEYKPPEEEPTPPSPGAEVMSHIASSKLVKRVLLPIYLILIIIFIYKFMGWYGNRKQAAQPKTVQQAQTVAPPVKQPVVVAPQPVAQTQLVAPPAAPVTENPPQTVNVPNQPDQLSMLVQQTKEEQDELNQMKTTLDTHDANIKNLNDAIAKLTSSVDSMSSKLTKLLKKPKPMKIKKKVVVPMRSYHVTAILPGRAWLEDNEGKTTTVRVGDMINGGRVQLISQQQGIVGLSTGEIIQYGANDF